MPLRLEHQALAWLAAAAEANATWDACVVVPMEADGQETADAGVGMGAAPAAVVTDAEETAAAAAAVRCGALMGVMDACIAAGAEVVLAADTWGALVDHTEPCSILRADATALGLKQSG